jgi:hypothetical protein
VALLTATQIIDAAMQMAGNTGIQAWCLVILNKILRDTYRSHEWPFLIKNSESLSTTASQAYTSYAGITDFWRVKIMQIKVSTTLFELTPLRGGLTAYYADTGRLSVSGRPSKYVVDRANSRFYWADSIPSAAETISLTYQAEEADVALGDTPKLVTHCKNGEMFLIDALGVYIQVRMRRGDLASADAVVAKLREHILLSERIDEIDATPAENLNDPYV